MHAWDVSNLRVNAYPEVDSVYVKGLRRSPYGAIRRSLQHSLPRSELLGLSYVGGSILETITIKAQKANLEEILQLLGLQLLPSFSMTEDALKREKEINGEKERKMQNLTRIVRRMQRCIRNSKNILS